MTAGEEEGPTGGRLAARLRPLSGVGAALLSRGVSRALTLLLLVALAREQSTQEFASYNYILVLAASVGVITDIGVALVAGRDVAHGSLDPAEAYRAAALPHLATNGLAAAAVILAGIAAPGPGVPLGAVLWAALFVFLNGIFNLQAELLRGKGAYWTEALLQVLAAVLQLALGIWVVVAGYGLSALLATLALKQLVVIVIAQVPLPSPLGVRVAPGLGRALLKRGIVLGAATTLVTLSLRLPQLIVGNVATAVEVANFAIASRFLEILTTVATTAGFGLLPALAARAGTPSFGRAVRRALAVGCLVPLVAVVPLALAVPWLTEAVFGARYADAAPAAQVFVLGAPLIAAVFLSQYALVALKVEGVVLASAIVALATAAAGSVAVLLEPTSLVGALVTTATFLTSGAVLTTAVLRRSAEPAPA